MAGKKIVKITGKVTLVPEKVNVYAKKYGIDLWNLSTPAMNKLLSAIESGKGINQALFRALAEQKPMKAIENEINYYTKVKKLPVSNKIKNEVKAIVRKEVGKKKPFPTPADKRNAYLKAARFLKKKMTIQFVARKTSDAEKKDIINTRRIAKALVTIYGMNKSIRKLSDEMQKIRLRYKAKFLPEGKKFSKQEKIKRLTNMNDVLSADKQMQKLVKAHGRMTTNRDNMLRAFGAVPESLYLSYGRTGPGIAIATLLAPYIMDVISTNDPEVEKMLKQLGGSAGLRKILRKDVRAFIKNYSIRNLASNAFPAAAAQQDWMSLFNVYKKELTGL
jgi:hypothetical protein